MQKTFIAQNPSVLWFLATLGLFTCIIALMSEATGVDLISTSFLKTLGKTLCLCLIAIAMDRYNAIIHPLSGKSSKKGTKVRNTYFRPMIAKYYLESRWVQLMSKSIKNSTILDDFRAIFFWSQNG